MARIGTIFHNEMMNSKKYYKVKNAQLNFLCPLCGAKRGLRYSSRLKFKNYIHILLTTLILSLSLYPFVGLRAAFSIFLVWPLYEFVNKVNFRREIPCPYCGFDATWYRRDIKVAKRLVKDFFAKHGDTEETASKKSEELMERMEKEDASQRAGEVAQKISESARENFSDTIGKL